MQTWTDSIALVGLLTLSRPDMSRKPHIDFRTGAENIILASYNEMNTFPATYNSTEYNTPGVKSFDGDLTHGLRNTVAAYSAYARIALVDVRALFANITADPTSYGIDERYVHPPTACLTGVYTSEGVPTHLCDDPEQHLFFDSYHPVKEVHATIGKLFQGAIQSFQC
jgi:phospholipase/lecithinase/hemolysin